MATEDKKMESPQEVQAKRDADPFWAIRGHAIQAYANVEQALCSLFAVFAEIEIKTAAVVFFRITNPRVVGEILDGLLTNQYGDGYSVFWNSLDKMIRDLVTTRNKVVHWNVSMFVNSDGYAGVALIPPDFYNVAAGGLPTLNASQLTDFIEKCGFVSRLCNMFHLFLLPQVLSTWPRDEVQTWRGIFQQRVVYPPPNNHPLFPKPKAPGSPPPPSPESPLPPPQEHVE
ncbi:MAG: hypothetical protein ABSH22_15520 [Tepidisphaeraceae bacterium]|jgi:hypothetical protein